MAPSQTEHPGSLQGVRKLASFLRQLLAGLPRPISSPRNEAELLSLICAVCAAIFAVKAFLAFHDLSGPDASPQLHDESVVATLVRVVGCCFEDVAVGIGCLVVGILTLRLAATRIWLTRSVRILAHLAAAAALIYLVVNAQLFHVLRHYLTFSLFRLAGGFHIDRSIVAYVTTPVKLALALLPTLTLAAHLGGVQRFHRLWQRAAARSGHPAWLCVSVALLALTGPTIRQLCLSDPGSDFGRNPHFLFIRSLFWQTEAPLLVDLEEADTEDFLPGRPHHTPNLLPSRPRNLIVITIESVAASWMEAYGCPLPTTPSLRKLADRTLVFENFYATANHSIASAHAILGGLYNDPSTLSTVIDYPDFPTPQAARWLQQRGYRTYFLASGGAWAWEEYRNMVPAYCVDGYDIARDPQSAFWRNSAHSGAPLDNSYFDAEMFVDARRALRLERHHSFALFLWAYETHAPYYDGAGPDDWAAECFPAAVRGNPEKEREFRLYLKALWRLDRLLGELVEELEALGLAEETLIAVTGDHGEAFGEHGLFGHGKTLFEEEVRVPLLLICPRLAPLGTRNRVVGSHVDLWATLTDLCGLPADPRWQGRSLVRGDGESRRAYFSRQNHAIGVREGRFKYIWDLREGRHLLYDLEDDPAERRNLAHQRPELCAAQHRRVAAWTAYQIQLTRQMLGR